MGKGVGLAVKNRRLTALLLAFALTLAAALAQAEGKVWRYGDETVPNIAITVDDCYKKEHVREVLDLCDQYGIKITFFPVGSTITEEDGDLWRRIVESGHEIGNHTMTHKNLAKEGLPYETIRSQFIRMEKSLDAALGYHYEVRLFRPAYGNAGYAPHWRLFEKCGYPNIIKWSVSQTDFKKCIKLVKNGSILLFHANAKDVKCLTELIPAVLEAGFTPVTVSELLCLEPIEKERSDSELVFPPEAAE